VQPCGVVGAPAPPFLLRGGEGEGAVQSGAWP
jgi:hypothetical protein